MSKPLPPTIQRKAIGHRLRVARLAVGMSQQDFAQAIGVTNTALSQWETGARAPALMAIVRIAELFDIPTDYILRGSLNGLPEAVRKKAINS